MLGKRLDLFRWLRIFLKENQGGNKKKGKEKENRRALDVCERANRFEKITILKRKWEDKRKLVEVTPGEIQYNTARESQDKWKVWRKTNISITMKL